MLFWLGLVIGLSLGWVIEWVIDWRFWRSELYTDLRADSRLRAELDQAQREIQALQAQLTPKPSEEN